MAAKTSIRRKTLVLIVIATLPAILAIFTQCKKDKLPANGDPEKFIYLTENYAPFNYSENDQANGVSVDILEDIFKGLNLSVDRTAVKVTDWAAAYDSVLKTPGSMLFSTVKTPEREGLFKWVGPIAPHAEVVIFLKTSSVQLQQVTDLNNYFTGVLDGYSSINTLMDRGVYRANIVVYNTLAELYTALEVKEVQCIAYSEEGHQLAIQTLGYPAAEFAAPFGIHSDELYYAFNIETTDELIANFQDQLNQIKNLKEADGSSKYEKILNRYSLIQHTTDGITDDMVMNLVNRTATDIQADAPGTIAKINQGIAPYIDATNKALYAFVYNTDVVLVAIASNPAIAGTSFKGKTDVSGKKFRDEIVAGALANGTGWEDYIYTRPDQSGLYYKTTYYKLATGSNSKTYIVCAGKYK